MLVLSRKNDQAVVIGGLGRLEDTIKITVLDIGGGRVRLGIETAQDVPVHREEVWTRIRAGYLRASSVGVSALTVSPSGYAKTRVLPVTEKGRSSQSWVRQAREA